MFVIGIDDAGRGPIIGPMILAGVLLTSEQEKLIKNEGAKDSKLIVHSTRIKLAEFIEKNSLAHKVIKVSAEEIDKSLTSGTNLNSLEAMKCAEIISFLNKNKEKIKVIVDCPSTNLDAWKHTLITYLSKFNKDFSNLEISCEHKADFNHPVVSAASILAKVAREEEVSKIHKEYEKYGNIGSGYPSDPITKEFLKKHGKELENSGLFRKTWATWKNLFGSQGQGKLF